MNSPGIQSRKRFGCNKLKTKVCNKETFVMLNWAEHLMKQSKFLTFCLIAAFAGSIPSVAGQVINPSVQNVSSRAVTSRSAPVARPIANTSMAAHVAPRPTGFNPRIVGSSAPRVVAQPGANLQRNYSPPTRTLNPTFAAFRTQQSARVAEQAITLDRATRARESRTLPAIHERRGFGTQQPITLDPAIRESELRTLATMRDRRGFRTENRTLAAIDAQRHVTTHDPAAAPQLETREAPKDLATKKWRNRNDQPSYADAFRRHWHEWHDRNWWHDHCDAIVFVSIGYYFLDGSYWYPAYGYDPLNSYYDYDGPIYTYSNLLPDEVIANVQTALQDAGYYFGAITGSLSLETRAALANFQRDYGLQITGAIDEATVETLGLY